MAIVLSVLSFQYYSFTVAKIAEVAADDIRLNAKTQSGDLASILERDIDRVATVLGTLPISAPIQNGDVEVAKNIINHRQEVTSDITDFYFWLDQDGRLLWSSDFARDEADRQQFQNADLSGREYFSVVKQTGRPYYSSQVEPLDGIPRIFLAMPVFSTTEEGTQSFSGVVVAAIKSITIGQMLKEELQPGFESRVTLIDKNGIMLYTRNTNWIGKSIFGEELKAEYAKIVSPEVAESIPQLLNEISSGETGSIDAVIRDQMTTAVYQPVVFNGEHLLTLAVLAPHSLAGDVGLLIEQQRNFGVITTVSIGAVGVGVAFLVLTWNRRLEGIVRTRTGELQESNKQLAQANEQLHLHDRMQREFINVAAHELRTPTQAILGYSDLFYMKPDSREEAMQAITRNALRLERLTNNILDVTKIEGHKLELNKEEFNLNEVVQSALEDAKQQIPNGSVEFASEFKTDNLFVEADKARITQVISNLVNNAIKFTKRGTISITTDTRNNEAMVSVQDTGTGIHQDVMPRLFVKFTSKSQTGTGLGLFISKSIIEAHGGRMQAENNPDGKGATFSFSLPITAPAIYDA